LRNLVYDWPIELVHDAVSVHSSGSNNKVTPITSPTGSLASPSQMQRLDEGSLIPGSTTPLMNTHATKPTTRTYPKLTELKTELQVTTEAIQLLPISSYHLWVHKAEEIIRGLTVWLRHYHKFNHHTRHHMPPVLDTKESASSPAVSLVMGYCSQLEALLGEVPVHSDTTRVTSAFQAYLTEESCSTDSLSQPTWQSLPKDVLEDLGWANVCQGLFRIDTILVKACQRPLVSKAVPSSGISGLAEVRQNLTRKHQSCYLSYIDWVVGSCLAYWHRYAVQIYSKLHKRGSSDTTDAEWKQQLIGGTMPSATSWQKSPGTDPAGITANTDSKASTTVSDADGQRCTASAAALGIIYRWLQLRNLVGGYLQLPADIQRAMVERMRTALVGWFSVLLGLNSEAIATHPAGDNPQQPLAADQTMVSKCDGMLTLGENHPSSVVRQIFSDWLLLSQYFGSNSAGVAEDDTMILTTSQAKVVDEWAMRVEMALLEKASLSDSSGVSHVVAQMTLGTQGVLQSMKYFAATP
ncbi:hypothetical protein IWQ62_006370, partial [Dispira parvispora]